MVDLKQENKVWVCEYCGGYVFIVSRKIYWTYYCQSCDRDVQGKLIDSRGENRKEKENEN